MGDHLGDFAPFLLVLSALVIAVWFGRRRARQPKSAQRTDHQRSLDERQRLTKAIGELEVNLMEFGRDIEGRLDTRIHMLSELIRSADEKIERLETLAGEKRRHGSNVPPLHMEIYRLADDGLDKVEIARRTSMTPGEVELILGLRKSRES